MRTRILSTVLCTLSKNNSTGTLPNTLASRLRDHDVASSFDMIDKQQARTARDMIDEQRTRTARAPSVLHLNDMKDAPAPEVYWTLYRPLALLFVGALIVFFSGSVLCLVPLLVIASFFRNYQVQRLRYYKKPEDLKIAVIGGGWGGLQIVDRLQELGVTKIHGFERWDDVGGTWHPNAAYFNQAIHAPMWVSGFANYPYGEPNCKLQADEVQQYNVEFCKSKNLRRFYRFNANVEGINYDTASNTAALDVTYNQGNRRARRRKRTQEGPFDLVIFASFNCEPYIPVFEGQEDFKGKIIHSSLFGEEAFRDIVDGKKKVVIIGGGKTSVDLLIPFRNIGYDDRVSWLYRRPYMFFKMEYVFGPPSAAKLFYGLSFILTIFATLVSTRLSNWIAWCTGSVWTYEKEGLSWKDGPFICKGGQMDKEQRRTMNGFDPNKRYRSGVERIERNGLRLLDGRFVEADVLLLATSATSGFHRLQLTKDGKPFAFDPEERFINSFTTSSYPVLGIHSTSLTFGPQRARATGDLAVYHSCILENPLPKDKAQRLKRWQFGPLFKAANIAHVWEASSRSGGSLSFFATEAISFLLSGMLDIFDFVVALVKLLCLGKQDPFDLSILPPFSHLSTAAFEGKQKVNSNGQGN